MAPARTSRRCSKALEPRDRLPLIPGLVNPVWDRFRAGLTGLSERRNRACPAEAPAHHCSSP